MSSSLLSLGSLTTLVSLPLPFNHENGRVQAAAVSSFSESRLKKRHEVVVAIDGEAVSIYDARNPRLISSYALPPQSSSLTSPCSVCFRATKRKLHRFTYAAVSNDSSQQMELLCFEESGSSAEQTNMVRCAIKLRSRSPIVGLGIVPRSTIRQTPARAHNVAILQRDSTLTLFSGGTLDLVLEQSLVMRGGTKEVVYATFLDVDNARTGFLRDRGDVLARFDVTTADMQQRADGLLVLVVRSSASTSKADVSLYGISNRLDTQSFQLEALSNWNLPELIFSQQENGPDQPKYSFDTKSGTLQTIVNGVVQSVSLDGLQPRVLSPLQHNGTRLEDCVRISSSLVLAASSEHYGIYDTKYNCALAIQSFAIVEAPSSLKRKFRDDLRTGPLNFVTWFPKLGQVIAISGCNLVSIQVSTKQGNSKRRKIDETPLIDVIGKGLFSDKPRHEKPQFQEPIGSPFEDSLYLEQSTEWPSRVERFNELVNSGKDQEFDREFARELGVPLKEEPNGSAEDVSWNFASDQDGFFVSAEPPRSDTTESSESRKLRIAFYPPNTFRWLTLTGQLTPELITEALKFSNTPDLDTFSARDVVSAIAEFDSSFRLLYSVLREHSRLELDVLVHATKYILQSLDEAKSQGVGTSEKMLLTNGDVLRVEKDLHVNGISQDHSEDEGLSDADAAFEELDHALTTLETGMEVRSECLRLAFGRLNSFPASRITTAIRSAFSLHELVLLVYLLRIELADGGWHSRYIDADHEALEPDEQYDHTLSIVVKMLGCAVDAIGVTGWLTSTTFDSGDALEELLDSLRDEIGAVLEGLHEVTFLKGLLREFVRYGWMREEAEPKPEVDRKDGAEITIKRAWDQQDKKILPLGLKVEKRVSATKVKSGGEIRQRSKRDIGREISMAVGKYTFEEIRV